MQAASHPDAYVRFLTIVDVAGDKLNTEQNYSQCCMAVTSQLRIWSKVVGYYMVLLCQWLCHLCGELWYHTRAEGFTYVSFTHTHTKLHAEGK
jgi:hypothetical protein